MHDLTSTKTNSPRSIDDGNIESRSGLNPTKSTRWSSSTKASDATREYSRRRRAKTRSDSSLVVSSGRNRHRRFPPECPLGDEVPNSIRTLPSGRRQARIDRYRKYRQQSVGSYQTTNLVGVTLFADTLGAMDSMACRETTVCRDKWGEQWSSNRVHRAGRVDPSLMKGLRCRLSLNTCITHRKEEKRCQGRSKKTDKNPMEKENQNPRKSRRHRSPFTSQGQRSRAIAAA